ncbi:nucleotidyl transferase AbiEii/AbiGii toxin family protein [Halomicronema sp. CCY15110]|uniref:nucleotidyl transferase AbiEii/AbiGii toxin family protein n=1 Tax=Halomicronema sp. CCY15110 TaxID=2767773 RepID=UPI001EF2A3A8|nr:nucleotidyl transferase AbiEii/AbiGii toxin family protein [Halomicronema sp. CCY15110]
MGETLPLATIQAAVFEFLQNRDDVVIFGAQAVNAWVSEPRMTQEVDLLTIDGAALAEDVRSLLSQQFQIAVRVREVKAGLGYRVYQLQKTGNRHLVDIRSVEKLPAADRIENVLILSPAALIAQKVIAFHQRRGKPKAGTHWRDIAMLLLTFPELKQDSGSVTAALAEAQASAEILAVWQDFVQQDIQPIDEDEDF